MGVKRPFPIKTRQNSNPKLPTKFLFAQLTFEKEIEKHPEFMDCLRLSGDVDYISFTCARNIQELNKICDRITKNTDLGVSRIVTRVILERAKWYLGYPLAKLKWLE